MTRPRTGILGGTFDPIHLGHVRAPLDAKRQLDLERVILVPSATPPHKVGTDAAPVAPAELRLEWARAAVAQEPGLEVDDLELRRAGKSFTVDTVREIGARTAPEKPVFLIGDDAFALFATWRKPAELMRLAHFAVLTRPPRTEGQLKDWLPEALRDELDFAADGDSATHRTVGTWTRLLHIDALEISSSGVRARLRAEGSVRYLLPEAIRDAVVESGIYSHGDESDPAGEATVADGVRA